MSLDVVALAKAKKPQPDTVLLPPALWRTSIGSPALGAFGAFMTLWGFDPTSAEYIGINFFPPASWENVTAFDVDIHWAVNGTSGGNVVWVVNHKIAALNDGLNAGAAYTVVTAAPAAAGTVTQALKTTKIGTSIPVTAGQLMAIRVGRDAANADDTNTNDSWIGYVRFTPNP